MAVPRNSHIPSTENSPLAAPVKYAQPPVRTSKLDRQIQLFLKFAHILPRSETLPIWASRCLFELQSYLFSGPRVQGITQSTIKVTSVPSRKSQRQLVLQHFSPWGDKIKRALLFVHGGGWILGSHLSHRRFCEHLASTLRAHVFAIDYRRPPESPLDVALEDVEEAWLWLWNHPSFGTREGLQLAICGDSAGAHLATMVSCQLPRHQHPIFQALIYPVTSYDFQGISMDRFQKGFYLTRSLMEWFWKQALAQKSDYPFNYSPMHSPNVTHSPPTLVVVSDHDILYDQGVAYAQKLQLHGIAAELLIIPGMIHGFINLLGFPSAYRSTQQILSKMSDMFIRLGK